MALKGKKLTEEHKKRIKEAHKGLKHSKKVKEKMRLAHAGKKLTDKHRIKMSEAKQGKKCYNWQGGLTNKNQKIRIGVEWRLWRESVFARDNWVCQKCSGRGGKLNPHHIKNFAQYPELRFAIDNGITFCLKCHRAFHRKYGYKNNTKEQVIEFIEIY